MKGAELPSPDRNLARQREVVDAFFSAARGGDFDALVALLDPDVVLRIDAGVGAPVASMVVRSAGAVARRARSALRSWLARPGTQLRSALVNGAAGVIVTIEARPVSVMGFTVAEGRIVEIDSIADADRLHRIAVVIDQK